MSGKVFSIAPWFDASRFFGEFDSIKEAFDSFYVKDGWTADPDYFYSREMNILIGVSERPMKITGKYFDSEMMLEDMEDNAFEEGDGNFESDPFEMKKEEYKELDEEIAKTITQFLHKKFPYVLDENGEFFANRSIGRYSLFDKDGNIIKTGRNELRLPKGWKVGNPEPEDA